MKAGSGEATCTDTSGLSLLNACPPSACDAQRRDATEHGGTPQLGGAPAPAASSRQIPQARPRLPRAQRGRDRAPASPLTREGAAPASTNLCSPRRWHGCRRRSCRPRAPPGGDRAAAAATALLGSRRRGWRCSAGLSSEGGPARSPHSSSAGPPLPARPASARLSRAGPPAAAGARRQPPPWDGATMRRRLWPSASSGPQHRAGPADLPFSRKRGRSGGDGTEPRPAKGAGAATARSKMAPRPPHPRHHGDHAPPPPAAGARAAKQRGARCALRCRAEVVAAAGRRPARGPGSAMEGGGNSKGTGLGGLFGAGGVGYSHADLAGVPREYRRAGATGGAGPGGRCRRARGGSWESTWRGPSGLEALPAASPAGSGAAALPPAAAGGGGRRLPPLPGPRRWPGDATGLGGRAVVFVPSVLPLARFLENGGWRSVPCFNHLGNLTA